MKETLYLQQLCHELLLWVNSEIKFIFLQNLKILSLLYIFAIKLCCCIQSLYKSCHFLCCAVKPSMENQRIEKEVIAQVKSRHLFLVHPCLAYDKF